MNSLWVRDLLKAWHKAATELPDVEGRYAVRCLNTPIDVDEVGMPAAGAVICNDCMNAIEAEGR